MRLLLDTHILIRLTAGSLERLHPHVAALLIAGADDVAASVASLWEVAIKTRLGKLAPGVPLDKLAHAWMAAGLTVLAIDARHAVADVQPAPDTRDPFDRLLLAQCGVEGRRLVTVDGALMDHPLAARFG